MDTLQCSQSSHCSRREADRKTFIIRQFIRTHFEYVVELNFYSNPKDREIFKEGRGASDIVSTICLRFPEFKVVKGKSVLFLDELQECPEAITAIKFLVEGTDVEIVASGSMLGVAYKSPRSYPVGSVSYINMHPMSFEEFLLSQGVNNDSIDDIRAHVKKRIPFGKGLLETIRTYFRAYILIGGMPECVLRYNLGKPDPNDAIDTQADIIDSYRKDNYSMLLTGTRLRSCGSSMKSRRTSDAEIKSSCIPP